MSRNVQEYESINDSMITITSRSVQSRLLRKAVAVSFWALRQAQDGLREESRRRQYQHLTRFFVAYRSSEWHIRRLSQQPA